MNATASDNVGVTKVEFWLDGTLKSTDTLSPYSWSSDTLTATNGSHSLVAKAYDAANNVGTSPTVTVSVNNVLPTNVGGWRIEQLNATLNYTIPAGTTIPAQAANSTRATTA